MLSSRLSLLTLLAMIAFAGNSILCRLALTATSIDPASFTSIRLLSGAITLIVLLQLRKGSARIGGSWMSALALLAYAAGFSYAYVSLATGTGALILFGTVQATMIGYGLFSGERPNTKQLAGIALALLGLLVLLLPGAEAPPLAGGLLMAIAGISWAVYSLRGRGVEDATQDTAGNFIRATPIALVISLLMWASFEIDLAGALYAVASGVLASGVGYAIWYTVLPALRATTAATVQLSVPAIATIGGVVLLSEPISLRLALASGAILGGVAIYVLSRPRLKNSSPHNTPKEADA